MFITLGRYRQRQSRLKDLMDHKWRRVSRVNKGAGGPLGISNAHRAVYLLLENI